MNAKVLRISYFWQTNPFWKNFISLIVIISAISTFFEPKNRFDKSLKRGSKTFNNLLIIEFFSLTIYLIDWILEIIHRLFDMNHKIIILKNKKFVSKSIFYFMLWIDALLFYSTYPMYNIIRFSRILRICNK